jgi:hypothetical protein
MGFATVVANFRNCLRDDLLEDIGRSVREVVRASHGRSRETEKLLERLLEMIQSNPIYLIFGMFYQGTRSCGTYSMEVSTIHECANKYGGNQRVLSLGSHVL